MNKVALFFFAMTLSAGVTAIPTLIFNPNKVMAIWMVVMLTTSLLILPLVGW